MRYGLIWPQYAKWWDAMVIKPERTGEFTRYAQFAIDNKARYQEVEQTTGVPWVMIAVIHRRESITDAHGNPRFDTYLGNGQYLTQRTTIVPRDRGPFLRAGDTNPDDVQKAFVAGGVDAFKLDGLTSVSDWRLEKQLFYETGFNGWGYYPHPSPYIFGGTNIQIPGKYIRDGVYDGSVWDPQPGCAPIMRMIAKLDPSVTFTRETA